jgi:hypothetical protein
MLYRLFGATYGSGTYGGSTYSSTGSSTGTTSTGAPPQPGSLLTNTGFDVLAAATLACAIICSAIAVRYWRRKPVEELSE